MPVYTFESEGGRLIEKDFSVAECPKEIEIDGIWYRKILSPVQFCVPEQHKAITYAGREGDRRVARHYRQNKRVAEGLANGSMMPPEGRDVAGDKQPREFIAQLNSMYDSAKHG